MRDMHALATEQDDRGDANALAGELPALAAVGVSAAAIDVRAVRAGKPRGPSGTGEVAGRSRALTAQEHVARGMEKAVEVGECLEWQGAMGNTGKQVPIVRSREGRNYSAQVSVPRVLWEQVNGPIAPGMVLWRHCCNPRCVNLAHFTLGTRAEWNKHRTKLGLFKHTIGHILNLTKGARNRATTINSMEKAREVRSLLALHGRREVAQMTGVSYSMVNDIAQGRTWKDYANPFAGLGA